MKKLLIGLLMVILITSTSHAQGWKVVQPPPNCDLSAKAYDNPFSDNSGWIMRRYEWHAFYAGLSTVTAIGIHKVTHLPPWASATIATIGVGFVPHIRGALIQRKYPINPLDWAFDGWTRSAPAWFVLGHTDANGQPKWENHAVATIGYFAGYAALACYASP